jgi:two-component sensor histidine kinase
MGSNPIYPTKIINMEEVNKVVEVLYEIGVSKEVVKSILLDELLTNASKYAGNQEAIGEILMDKLTIDQYISLQSYKLF